MLTQIEAVLNQSVRPELAKHEGDLIVDSYQDGILKVRLLGRCSTCPSAQLSTEAVIKTAVMDSIPEVKDVILVQSISEETLGMARAILNRRCTK